MAVTMYTHSSWRFREAEDAGYEVNKCYLLQDAVGSDYTHLWSVIERKTISELAIPVPGAVPLVKLDSRGMTAPLLYIGDFAGAPRGKYFYKLLDFKHPQKRAGVYSYDGAPFEPGDTVAVYIPVTYTHEVRTWVKEGQLLEATPYLLDGMIYSEGLDNPEEWDTRKQALDGFHNKIKWSLVGLEGTLVVDYGLTDSGEWKIIELNSPHTSDWYGADLKKVIPTWRVR